MMILLKVFAAVTLAKVLMLCWLLHQNIITECMEGHDGVGADDEFVDPRRCTPPKQNRVIEDSEEFVDPPVTQFTQVHGGESFMRGIQVSEMYGYNDVDPVFDKMRGSCFELPEIDYTKEDSDIYVGRLFKDKAQFKLTNGDLCTCEGVHV